MKLVTYKTFNEKGQSESAVGFVHGDEVYPLRALKAARPATWSDGSRETLPVDMLSLLQGGEETMGWLQQAYAEWVEVAGTSQPVVDPVLQAPVPRPVSCRDAYAFRQHVETSRRNRGLEMIPEFDAFPVFYFTNHQAIYGPGEIACMPRHFEKLDFELEVAIVLNRGGRNIPAAEADQYIGGYMIMNDLSARVLQMEEMKLNLGPAKGKDFATVLGPWLVTPDELNPYRVDPRPGHVGNAYRLDMRCFVNDKQVSHGQFADMHWTFAEIIEHVSYGVDLYPGDVIGSGTVGTGCFLELNGTGRLADPAHFEEQWLQPGDVVELEVTGLGRLSNRVILDRNNENY